MVAGDLAGLGLRGTALPGTLPAAAAAVFMAVGASLRGRGRDSTGPGLLLAACAALGAGAGIDAGRAADASCLAGLASEAALAVRGRSTRGVEADRGGGPGSRRVDLTRAVVAGPGGRCRVPRLVVRTRRVAAPVAAGGTVEAWGRWYAWPDGGPRPPARRGFLRAEGLRPAASGPAGPSVAGRGLGAGSLRGRLRAAAGARLEARLPADVAAAGTALVTADRSGLDPAVSRRFAEAGLAHLLAISGLHVGLLGGGLVWLVGRFARLRERRYAVAAALVAAYVLLLGAPPAALRAGVVFGGWSAARARGSPLRVSELVGAAAALGVLMDPLAPSGAGWQLSFAGFTGLLVGGGLGRRATAGLRSLRGPGGRRRRKAVVALVASAGAFLATAPFAAAHFGRTAPVAVVANGLGVPLVALALPALMAAVVLPGFAGETAAGAAGAVLRGLFRLVDALAGVPGGHGAAAPPGWGGWIAALLLLAAALRLTAGARPWRVAPLVAGALVAPTLVGALARLGAPATTLLCQLDVGQGDAAVVRTRRDHWLVLDAGPAWGARDAGLRKVVPFIRGRGGRRVELLALSHPHLDHLGGAESVLTETQVVRLLDPGNPVASEPYGRLLDAAAEAGVRWVAAAAGDRLRVDEVELLVLGPGAAGEAAGPWRVGQRDINEASLSLRLRVGGFRYLNTGDAPASEEHDLLARWPADSVRATVLKAGHHGSHTSSAPAWLAAARPKVVVVSAGRGNRYGHPHAEALDRLRAAGPDTVWRTDRDGDLCLQVRPDGAWRRDGERAWRAP